MNTRYFLFVTLLAIVCAGLAWWFQVPAGPEQNAPTSNFGQPDGQMSSPAPAPMPSPSPGTGNTPSFQ